MATEAEPQAKAKDPQSDLAPPKSSTDNEANSTSGEDIAVRDEQDGTDLEDNVEPEQVTASQLRTRKRIV